MADSLNQMLFLAEAPSVPCQQCWGSPPCLPQLGLPTTVVSGSYLSGAPVFLTKEAAALKRLILND